MRNGNDHFPPDSQFVLFLTPFSLCVFVFEGNTEEAGRLLGSKNVRVNCLDEVLQNCAIIMLSLIRKMLGVKVFLLLNNIFLTVVAIALKIRVTLKILPACS